MSLAVAKKHFSKPGLRRWATNEKLHESMLPIEFEATLHYYGNMFREPQRFMITNIRFRAFWDDPTERDAIRFIMMPKNLNLECTIHKVNNDNFFGQHGYNVQIQDFNEDWKVKDVVDVCKSEIEQYLPF